MCTEETANTLEIAVNFSLLDEITDPVKSPDAFLQNRPGLVFSIFSGKYVEIGFQAGTNLTSVSRTAAPSRILCIKHDGTFLVSAGLNGSTQPRVAGTNNGQIGF